MSLYCKIRKRLGSFLLDVDLEAGDEVLALLGASGCGKSMTLRCIAGIEQPDSGKIILDGKTLYDSDRKINLAPRHRKAGMLFQDYALFPNMTVHENIRSSMPRERHCEIESLITTFHLTGLHAHYPHQLSGGQRQRCALARMIASEPNLIMLDEPFSALDTFLRWQMEQEVAAAISRFRKTVLLVSHNRDEVYRLCDRATILSAGRNEAIRTKQDLYFQPRTFADALLTGYKNIFAVETVGKRILIPEIGAEFSIEPASCPIKYAGIRAKKMLPSFLRSPDLDTVDLPYQIESVTENVFSYILLVKPEGGTKSICWEISKDMYKEILHHPPVLSIPKNEITLLQD